MYLAEIHGKLSRQTENQEDILTSNVFSFFKYSDRTTFLYEFIRSLELEISINDALNAEFLFWPRFEDNTEPDLVIIIGDFYLLIEAKYHSGFGQETQSKGHQLIREIEGGIIESEKLGKKFKIIIVTAYYSEKSDLLVNIPEKHRRNIIWTNWQKIAFFLYQQIENNPSFSSENRLFANDLYELLVRKKLRNYEGSSALMVSFKALSINTGDVFFGARSSNYRGKFMGFMNILPIVPLVKLLTDNLFFQDQREFFNALLSEELVIQPVDIIFLRRSGNE
ncbi:MAG: hypothetical protein ACOYZ6_00185 [Chloroflexota bacterium]